MENTPDPARKSRRSKRNSAEVTPAGLSSPLVWPVLGVTLLCAVLGGGTEPWSAGAGLCAAGAMVAVFPAAGFLRPDLLRFAVAVLLGLGLASLLPAFGSPSGWRETLLGAGVKLPFTISPAPWKTLGSWIVLSAGTTWFLWISSLRWSHRDRRLLVSGLGIGVAVLAGISVLAHFLPFLSVSWWHPERGIGMFPNRNQTADLFALGGFAAVACMVTSHRAKPKWRRPVATQPGLRISSDSWGRWGSLILWVIAIGIIVEGVILTTSRAGIVLLGGMTLLWLAAMAAGIAGKAWRTISIITIACGFMGAAAVVLYGGVAVDRLQNEAPIGFRGKIWADTWQLIRHSPWTGIGMGNFEGIFALFRQQSAIEQRVLHPESDWLWVAAELGPLSIIALLGGLVALGRRALPFSVGSDRPLRSATMVGSLGFLAHSFVDVSGHRLGSLLPAILLASLSLHPSREITRPSVTEKKVQRIAGAIFCAAGLLWIFASLFSIPLPGRLAAALNQREAVKANGEARFMEAASLSSRSLDSDPLQYLSYYNRGAALAYSDAATAADADFRRALLLQPTSVKLAWTISTIWIIQDPAFAPGAWAECFRRAKPSERSYHYANAMSVGYPSPLLRESLWQMAEKDHALQLIYLAAASPKDFEERLSAIRLVDPVLDEYNLGEKQALFHLWIQRDDPTKLAQLIQHQEDWHQAGWKILAADAASREKLDEACAIARKYLPVPKYPDTSILPTQKEARLRLLANPGDIPAAYALYLRAAMDRSPLDTLRVLKAALKEPNCPTYITYLSALAHADQQQWLEAWDAFKRYDPALEQIVADFNAGQSHYRTASQKTP